MQYCRVVVLCAWFGVGSCRCSVVMAPPGGSRGGFKGVELAMWCTLLFAIVCMICATAVPQWYVGRSIRVGLWKICYSYDSPCEVYSVTSSASSSLNSARGFSVLAIIMALVGMFLAGAIALMTNKVTLLRIPRVLFGIAGGFKAISALSFVAFVHRADTFSSSFSYGASFAVAWVAVYMSFAATLFAHLHHRALAIEAIQRQTRANPV
ncbi:peripheral myelin protein 22-like isoform X1 [Sycon ciliatum]|uniref:peripheral myelin protein 22-like isoform X1 n=1 Tax=Sycon ciliatum TaxID=27933 RepID=UPI0031F6BA81